MAVEFPRSQKPDVVHLLRDADKGNLVRAYRKQTCGRWIPAHHVMTAFSFPIGAQLGDLTSRLADVQTVGIRVLDMLLTNGTATGGKIVAVRNIGNCFLVQKPGSINRRIEVILTGEFLVV